MPISKRALPLISTLALGLSLGLQPFAIDWSAPGIGPATAAAKGGDGGGNGGGGGGNGGANGGGGNGGTGGGGRGGDNGGQGSQGGRGTDDGGRGNGGRSDSGRAERAEKAERSERTEKAERPEKTAKAEREKIEKIEREKVLSGRLNASNASIQAAARANPRSAVGQIAAYKAAMAADEIDVEIAAKALSQVANKSLTLATVHDLNTRLGLTVDEATEQQILDKAIELQAN